MDPLIALEHAELDTFRARTGQSRASFERAQQVMPGGDTRTGTFHAPYPLFMSSGAGCGLTDADGHEYVDLLGNFTSLIHGHAHPAIVSAITAQAGRGTVHGTANDMQVELAELLCQRVPSVERLRFCNSGTEATLGALRAAKAFTGRHVVMKMAGGYHGSHDQVAVAASPPFDGVPPGLSPGATGEVVLGAFNDLERSATIIRQHKREMAAVIVEPMLGSGALPADREFLEGLRAVTTECGVMLVFDEIITFRLDVGGMQQIHGVRPDLTTLGKIVGGGLPVGAFGGRADVMASYDPGRPGAIAHSGTYNGNATTMAAGLATLALFDGAAVQRLNALGDTLRARLNATLASLELPACVTGFGSLMQLHFLPPSIRTPEHAALADKRLMRLMHLSLLNRGVFSATRQLYVMSTAMDAAVLDDVAARWTDALTPIADATRAAAAAAR